MCGSFVYPGRKNSLEILQEFPDILVKRWVALTKYVSDVTQILCYYIT